MQGTISAVAAVLALVAAPALARTDLGGCTRSASGNTYVYYVPGTGELCSILDCGGGRAPPKTNVPGCALYTGTETVTPSFLPGFGPSSAAAATPSTVAQPVTTPASTAQTRSPSSSARTTAFSTPAASSSASPLPLSSGPGPLAVPSQPANSSHSNKSPSNIRGAASSSPSAGLATNASSTHSVIAGAGFAADRVLGSSGLLCLVTALAIGLVGF